MDILNFEYAAIETNLSTLSKHDLNGKKIGCRYVKSSDRTIETIDESRKRILTCVDTLGKENILIDHDRRFGRHTLEGAYTKLANMCAAAKSIREENL